jgi:hypothetical protein
MSRPVIGAVAAGLIALLTAVAYFVTTSSLEDQIRGDIRLRVAKATDLLLRNAELEGLGLLKRAEALSRDPRLVMSLAGEQPDPRAAEDAFREFRASLAVGEARPDVLALTDASGRLIALLSGDQPVFNPIADTYLNNGRIEYPALALALSAQRYRIADVWRYESQGPMRVAVAPVIDTDRDELTGAVLLGYGITNDQARRETRLLGAEVAYFFGGKVVASSLAGGGGEVSPADLAEPLFGSGGLAPSALASDKGIAELVNIELGGHELVATAGRMPRFSSKPLPADYPAAEAGALVAMSVDDALAPLTPIKLALLLVGLGSIIVALLAMFVAVKRVLVPLDRIELGIGEILNGDLDYTFEPVGSDLDGLANGLNVLLARLLGRPEPGEEEYDEDGNLIKPSSMQFDPEGLSPKDAEAVRLAREPETDYYDRLYREYTDALRAAGQSVSGMNRDSFLSKLRLSETTLREKYRSEAVRFKVVAADGKVTLKPVPINPA